MGVQMMTFAGMQLGKRALVVALVASAGLPKPAWSRPAAPFEEVEGLVLQRASADGRRLFGTAPGGQVVYRDVMTSVSTAMPPGITAVTATNHDGTIAVGPGTTPQSVVRWTAGVVEDLNANASPNLRMVEATGVSNNGQVIVGTALVTDPMAKGEPIRVAATYNTATQTITLRGMEFGPSRGAAISTDGTIGVGFVEEAEPDGTGRWFRWSPDGISPIGGSIIPALRSTLVITSDGETFGWSSANSLVSWSSGAVFPPLVAPEDTIGCSFAAQGNELSASTYLVAGTFARPEGFTSFLIDASSPTKVVQTIPEYLFARVGPNSSSQWTITRVIGVAEDYRVIYGLGWPQAEPGVERTWRIRFDSCDGDANGDRSVNFSDITAVLANFGARNVSPCGLLNCPGDADNSGNVNFSDITAALANFGLVCPP
jgi:hypothetical protein